MYIGFVMKFFPFLLGRVGTSKEIKVEISNFGLGPMCDPTSNEYIFSLVARLPIIRGDDATRSLYTVYI